MFAGKTTKLLEIIRSEGSSSVVKVFRPTLDTRDDVLRSHNGAEWKEFTTVSTISDIIDGSSEADVVIVDEIQFFFEVSDDELVGLQKLSLTKKIICAGLDMSFKFIPFETTSKLMAIADNVVKMKSLCAICMKPSQLTTLCAEQMPLTTYLPSGTAPYLPKCRKCAF